VNIYNFDGQMAWDIEWLPDASGFLFSFQYVPLEIYSDIFEYKFTPEKITQLTHLGDNSARGLSISPDGQQVVFERVDETDATSSLWIMNRDGSGLHKLADDAGRPAWGRTPAPSISASTYRWWCGEVGGRRACAIIVGSQPEERLEELVLIFSNGQWYQFMMLTTREP